MAHIEAALIAGAAGTQNSWRQLQVCLSLPSFPPPPSPLVAQNVRGCGIRQHHHPAGCAACCASGRRGQLGCPHSRQIQLQERQGGCQALRGEQLECRLRAVQNACLLCAGARGIAEEQRHSSRQHAALPQGFAPRYGFPALQAADVCVLFLGSRLSRMKPQDYAKVWLVASMLLWGADRLLNALFALARRQKRHASGVCWQHLRPLRPPLPT